MYNFAGCACFNNANEIPKPILPVNAFDKWIPLRAACDEEYFIRGFGDEIQGP